MKTLTSRIGDERGNAPIGYALGLLVLGAVAQPTVALALLYRAEDMLRLLFGQVLSLF